jgi:O-antigen/teichoic acid export membrane protein
MRFVRSPTATAKTVLLNTYWLRMAENESVGSGREGAPVRRKRIPRWLAAWARDGVLLAGSQVAMLAVTTALAVLVARELGPTDFGIFSAFLSLSIVIALYTEVGLSTWLLRELSAMVARNGNVPPDEARMPVSAACGLNLLLGICAMAIALPFGWAFGSSADLVAALGGLMLYTTAVNLATALEAVFRANRMIGRVIAASVIEKATLVGVVLVALYADWGILGIAIGYACAGSLRCGFDALIVFGGMVKPRTPARRELASVVRRSLPFAIGSNSATAIVRLDTFLIGLLSASAAGYYAVGDRVATVALLVSSTAAATFFPIVAKHENAARASLGAAALMGAVGLLLTVPAIILSPLLIPALFGDAYSDAVPVVQIMLIGIPLTYASAILMVGLFSLGRERTVIVVLIPTLLVGSVVVVAGQLTVGVEGAAAGYAFRFALALAALLLVTGKVSRALADRSAGAMPRPPESVVDPTQPVPLQRHMAGGG